MVSEESSAFLRPYYLFNGWSVTYFGEYISEKANLTSHVMYLTNLQTIFLSVNTG